MRKLFYMKVKYNEKNNKKNPEQIAWDMFEKTGNPSYYMLYKKLKGID